MKSFRTLLCLPIFFVMAPHAFALEQGFTSMRDHTIFDDGSTIGDGYLFTGTSLNGQTRRGLVGFDLSSIPAGSTITAVSLSMNVSLSRGSQTVGVHRLSTDWVEGTNPGGGPGGGQGTPPSPGSSTWFVPWATPGGDFVATASASLNISGTGLIVFSGAGLSAAVQAWLDNPAGNFGLIIAGTSFVPGNAFRIDSTEDGASPPVLQVTYTLPPADTDHDNMPDDWENANGLVVGLDDSAEDKDGDGITNLGEYTSGTDPQDPRSYLHVTALSFTDSGGSDLKITWSSVEGISYFVEHASALGGPWAVLAGAESIPATAGAETTFTHVGAGGAGSVGFYRVGVVQ